VYMCLRSVLFGLCFLFTSQPVGSQQQLTRTESDSTETNRSELRADTSYILEKRFSYERIEKLKADPDLKYADPPTVGQTLWDRFLQFIEKLLSSLFSNTTFTGVGKIILYAVGLIALIYLILALLRVNAMTLLNKGADVASPARVFHENIHEMDFEKLIKEATTEKDFKVATRLVFLYALKILSDHHLIDWNAGKTNHEYVQEIQQPDLKDGFADLSTYFEYAWYGNFKVTSEIFDNMQSAFHNWRAKLEI